MFSSQYNKSVRAAPATPTCSGGEVVQLKCSNNMCSTHCGIISSTIALIPFGSGQSTRTRMCSATGKGFLKRACSHNDVGFICRG